MRPCAEVAKGLAELAALPLEELAPQVREHLAECAPCARAVWAQRIMQETLQELLMERRTGGRGWDDGNV